MKLILLATALSMGSVALAQSQPADQNSQQSQPTEQDSQAQPAEQDVERSQTSSDTARQPSGITVDDPAQASGPQGVTQQGTDPNGQAIPPAGMNQMPSQGMTPTNSAGDSAQLTPRPATTEYPPCSRTVTDSCVQTYERGTRRARRPRR
jgi:hypothetical protein